MFCVLSQYPFPKSAKSGGGMIAGFCHECDCAVLIAANHGKINKN